MSFRRDDLAAQEIIGFMLSMAAVMLLFGGVVGYGVTVRDDRVEVAAEAAVKDIALRLAEAINDAATFSDSYPDAHLNLTISLTHMPGATGFIAEAVGDTLYVNASNGASVARSLPPSVHDAVTGSISGTPEAARIRWDPALDLIILETL